MLGVREDRLPLGGRAMSDLLRRLEDAERVLANVPHFDGGDWVAETFSLAKARISALESEKAALEARVIALLKRMDEGIVDSRRSCRVVMCSCPCHLSFPVKRAAGRESGEKREGGSAGILNKSVRPAASGARYAAAKPAARPHAPTASPGKQEPSESGDNHDLGRDPDDEPECVG